MRYSKSWLDDRVKQIQAASPEYKNLRAGGSGTGGYQIYLTMGGPIKSLYHGTLKECLAFLEGILYHLLQSPKPAQ